MDVTSLLLQAANLMLTGMVVVFVFLMVLISVVKLMSALVIKYFPESTPSVKTQPRTAAAVQQGVPAAHVAAIAGAIHQHRQQSQK